ncbi:hypothetical protein D9V37_16705 [Nocardioides mangrovicus]|uniref:Uncharacterized protein n=1 Tax=Nocardioides mangrovicus TaxID=2478913 RepID=A0A3L8NYP7_9ACTN|nr:hypothetical protein [Nocardioides mangrovicus]RLV47772.1 hypothetical protein D9V37_16705 [Nocardioides mangrovicus]
MRNLWRLGGAAVALTAATAGALVSAPAHADDLAATSISIRSLQATVQPGGTDTITGDLAVAGGSGAGRTVSLEAHTPGTSGYAPVGTSVAGTNGGVSLQVTPDVTTLYRWHYDGATDARPSSSGTVRVVVSEKTHHAHRLGTTLSVRATKRAIGPNGTAIVRGHLRSGRVGLPNRQVLLLGHRSGQSGWHFVNIARTGAHGGIAFHVRPGRTTAYRLQYLGSQVFRPSHSGTVRVHVRQQAATSLSIRGRDGAHQRFVVSGQLRSGGHAVRSTRVSLWTHAAGSTTWVEVATHRTGSRGVVQFRRPQSPGTAYRLAFDGNQRYAASTSGTVVN